MACSLQLTLATTSTVWASRSRGIDTRRLQRLCPSVVVVAAPTTGTKLSTALITVICSVSTPWERGVGVDSVTCLVHDHQQQVVHPSVPDKTTKQGPTWVRQALCMSVDQAVCGAVVDCLIDCWWQRQG